MIATVNWDIFWSPLIPSVLPYSRELSESRAGALNVHHYHRQYSILPKMRLKYHFRGGFPHAAKECLDPVHQEDLVPRERTRVQEP